MNIKNLKIFLYVCETLNMTAVGTQLKMSQPAISQVIKEMEEYFEVILFERLSKQLFLTEAGKELRDYALHIVSLFVVPYQIVKPELDRGTIVEIKLSDVNLNRKLTIVTNRHKYITEPVREFIELVRNYK